MVLFAGFLSDQRGNVSDYFSILKECFESGIQIDKLYQFEKQSDNIEKFDELVKKEIADNSFEKRNVLIWNLPKRNNTR